MTTMQVNAQQMTLFALYRTYSNEVHGCDWKPLNPQDPDLNEFSNWVEAESRKAVKTGAYNPPHNQLDALSSVFTPLFSRDRAFENAAGILGLFLITRNVPNDCQPERQFPDAVFQSQAEAPAPPTRLPSEPEKDWTKPTPSNLPMIWGWRRHPAHRWVATGSRPMQPGEPLPKLHDIITIRRRNGAESQHRVNGFSGFTHAGLPQLDIRTFSQE